MIYVSENRKDSIFVARILRAHNLSPIPVPNYYDATDYQRRDGHWERVIERYSWGVVLYVDRPGASATIVATGDFDSATGRVTKDGQVKDVPINWYLELVRRCEMIKIEIPGCAGYWVAGVTCDGGMNQDTNENENACAWRRRCRLIQNHMITLDTDPRTYMNRYGQETLSRLLERLEKGTKPKKPKKRRRPRGRPKGKPQKATPEQKRERRYAPLKAMAAEFYEVLAKTVDGQKIMCCERRTEAVRSGCIYLVDRTEKGVYINIYLRREVGRAHKLAVIRLAPINGGLDIQIPDTERPGDLLGDLTWVSWKCLPMRSTIRTLKTSEHYRWMAERLASDALEALKSK